MRTEKLKPARPGLKVRDPERGGHMPETGAAVPLNSYWLRRKHDGDVVAVKAASRPSRAVATQKRDEE